MSDYKPTEHDGLRKDGQPDQRVGTGQFAQGKVDPHEAGKQGGRTSGGSSGDNYDDDVSRGNSDDTYDDDETPSSNSGNKSGGSSKGQFAHGKVDPAEAGRQGGQK